MRLLQLSSLLPILLATLSVAACEGPAGSQGPPGSQAPPSLAVTAVTPSTGSIVGGQVVTLVGTAFVTGMTVTFGGGAPSSVTTVNAATATAVSPASTVSGPVDVVLSSPSGQTATLIAGFTFAPSSGALVGSFGTGGVVRSGAGSNPAEAHAVTHDGSSLYIVGADDARSAGFNDPQWRIEKRSLATGALDPGFGVGGVVSSNPSTGSGSGFDGAHAVVHDGGSLYVVGYDYTTGDTQWRIEKRALSTGALVTGFGTGGVVTSNPSSGIDTPYAAIHDGTNLYVIGSDGQNLGDPQWRIEKRLLSTGALVAAFGSGGVVTSNPSFGTERPWAVASDWSSLYIVGDDNTPSASGNDTQWRIEKRSLLTGALDSGFGTGGVVVSDATVGSDVATAVVLAGPDLLVVGWEERSSADFHWQIQRRTTVSGALAGAVSANPSSGFDRPMVAACDGGSLYVAGWDYAPGEWQWRAEKRVASSGVLVSGFGAGGVATSNPTTGADYVNALTIDGASLYLVGKDANQWRIEKRTK